MIKEHQIQTNSGLAGCHKQFSTQVNQVKPPLGKLLGHICDQQELSKMAVNKLCPHCKEFYWSKTEDNGLGACRLLVTKGYVPEQMLEYLFQISEIITHTTPPTEE